MDNVCRTCLRIQDNLLPLYNDPELINKIETISPIQVDQHADYPPNICTECISLVRTFYNFRKVIINSDKEIRETHETLERVQATLSAQEYVEEEAPFDDKIDIKFEEVLEPVTNICDMFSVDPDEQLRNIKETAQKAVALSKICKCQICNKTFTSKAKLTKHRRTQHVPTGVCNICGAVIRADNLKKHIRGHIEDPVECKDCGKMFKNTESLRGHQLMHRNVTYTCETCGRVYKTKSEFNRHLKYHLDPNLRKAMCSLCGKSVSDLRRHMRSHTGERPHVCKYCNKGFTSTHALKVHVRQHTKERPYICECCSMGFPQRVSLRTHLKSKHGVC